MDRKTVAAQWILCPICGKKTRIKVHEDTIIRRFPLFCPKCKQETLVDLIDHKVHICTEPDV